MRRLLLFCILCIAFQVALAQTAAPTDPDGFAWLGQDRAAVWESGFYLMQVRFGNPGNTPLWSDISVPPALRNAKTPAAVDVVDSDVFVTSAGTKRPLALFWLHPLPGNSKMSSSSFELHQAVESNGDTWRTSLTKLSNDASMEAIATVALGDAGHGWALLSGDPGAGQLPEMLVTTADGGQHWTKPAGKGLIIGRSAPQMFLPRTGTDAWLAASFPDAEINPIVMTHTVDGGSTWARDTVFSQGISWCKECTVDEFSQQDSRFHPDRACFETSYRKPSGDRTAIIDPARYCLNEDGRHWSDPIRVRMPVVPFVQRGLSVIASLPLFADKRLGFVSIEADQMGRNLRNGGDARSDQIVPRYAIFMTRDGGENWSDVSSLLGVDLTVLHGSVQRVESKGSRVLLLLTGVRDQKQIGLLLYSADQGQSWFALTRC